MPIKHMVFLPFKSSISTTEIQAVKSALASLIEHIPQIDSFAWIENNSPENLDRGFLHGFVMEFQNATARQIYLEHPVHVKVAEGVVLPALVDGINSPLVFDYAY